MNQAKRFVISKALNELYNLGRRKITSAEKLKRKKQLMRRLSPRDLVLSGFPATQLVKLRYVTSFTLDPGVGTMVTKTFRANSLYQPEISPTGRQPMGHDQWSVVYDKYVVLSSKISISPAPTGINNIAPAVYGLLLSTTQTNTYTDYRTVMEARTGTKDVGHYGNSNNTPYGGKLNKSSFRKSYNTKRFFGVKNTLDNEDLMGDTENTAGTNPSEVAFYHFWAQSPDRSSDPGLMNYIATIDYIAIYRDPILLPAS